MAGVPRIAGGTAEEIFGLTSVPRAIGGTPAIYAFFAQILLKYGEKLYNFASFLVISDNTRFPFL